MHILEYAAIIAYALALVRGFSFGIYGLKHDSGGAFAVVTVLAAAGAVLLYLYLITTLN